MKFYIKALLAGGLTMMGNVHATTYCVDDCLISHASVKAENAFDINGCEQRLKNTASLTLPLEETRALLHQLAEFEIGQFLLENKGLNGYWISYAILHGPLKSGLSSLEEWMLHRAPATRATQERFRIFQRETQRHIRSETVMASIPCGVMDDLLLLDFAAVNNVHLIGVDLDQSSLDLAASAAREGSQDMRTTFHRKDAWSLDVSEAYDLLTSNGLNIYEPNDQRVIALYQEFYKALRPGGILITSFLTPPPLLSPESSWKNFDLDDAKKQRAIFLDIVQAKWQTFRTEKQTRSHLEEAGFKVREVIYDSQGMFPTVIAEK